ncbi:MAG: hypothetical protein HN725_13995 [Alphaproteobacteria bacterium]|nr:hypothetical protein [Alphaproteobacteria bacterium]MBT4082633.1 hypothetical protein [Alphaproteobacteria bacterium]MBT4545895.1 hypothetical protein [Alphaproteobacteria bacterium]MBT7746400.1 hypothetical protein [Alphaproteobacteria bacterium]
MLRTLGRIGILTVLSLGLSGCLMVHTVKQELLYSPEYVSYVTQDGNLPVEISGNLLGNSTLAGDKLLATIEIPLWIAKRKLTLVAPSDRGQGPRLVLVFNPASPLTNGDTLCANSNPEIAAPGERTTIIAAFCHDNRNVTRATGEGDVQSGLHDPRFIELLNDLIEETLPIRNLDHDTTDCQASPCG